MIVHFERNHQGLENRLISSLEVIGTGTASVKKRERVGGLLNYYYVKRHESSFWTLREPPYRSAGMIGTATAVVKKRERLDSLIITITRLYDRSVWTVRVSSEEYSK